MAFGIAVSKAMLGVIIQNHAITAVTHAFVTQERQVKRSQIFLMPALAVLCISASCDPVSRYYAENRLKTAMTFYAESGAPDYDTRLLSVGIGRRVVIWTSTWGTPEYEFEMIEVKTNGEKVFAAVRSEMNAKFTPLDRDQHELSTPMKIFLFSPK